MSKLKLWVLIIACKWDVRFMMYVLGAACCQQIHWSQIWHFLHSVKCVHNDCEYYGLYGCYKWLQLVQEFILSLLSKMQKRACHVIQSTLISDSGKTQRRRRSATSTAWRKNCVKNVAAVASRALPERCFGDRHRLKRTNILSKNYLFNWSRCYKKSGCVTSLEFIQLGCFVQISWLSQTIRLLHYRTQSYKENFNLDLRYAGFLCLSLAENGHLTFGSQWESSNSSVA